MCGIIAVLRRKSRRVPPDAAILDRAVAAAQQALAADWSAAALDGAARVLADLDRQLRGVPGTLALLGAPAAAERCREAMRSLQQRIADFERQLDADARAADAAMEQRNAALVRLKDAVWAVLQDRLPHADAVRALAGTADGPDAIAAWSAIQLALAALDRLEVRGRDSAGLCVMVSGIDATAAEWRVELQRRAADPLFQHGSVRATAAGFDFVYKHAAEIGELGDNVRTLREAIARDDLLHAVLQRQGAEALVLGHTRWASVGIISEPNAHPLNSEEVVGDTPPALGPYVIGALNGDVDNHVDLVRAHGLCLPPEITTDAKVIPTLVSRRMAQNSGTAHGGTAHGGTANGAANGGAAQAFAEAFRQTVAEFEGSVAIAAATAADPHRLALALRGSGQALYVGLAEDTFVVASEPYGVIEECDRYLRMDGETPGNAQNPNGSRGQVVVLERQLAGEAGGIARQAYDGTPLPLAGKQLAAAAITTRDIDRAGFPHFLLKEITEAPRSWQKTLRGRIVEADGRLRTALPPSSLPQSVADGLRDGRFRRLLVIGQGTAAVAGQAVAEAIGEVFARSPLDVRALPATELSGFGLRDDMRDTLVVAISQSGTTTDTNRTVDLARGRGAPVLAIVNRRGSDLTDKADGVVYTSDGRDIEMSVASTKAFYAQCAAGWLLAWALGRAAGLADDRAEDELLCALLDLPAAMDEVLRQDEAIAAIARAHAPQRRHWALVGNGKNRVAAAEVRIKLSELCYKSIASDATEDKKHIDLSSEPLILVCAAGLTGGTADDVAKEVAIYRAHKACPIVVATAGETRFAAAAGVIEVPRVHGSLAFVLSTMAGHLFGYRAALAIDELALPLRRARGAIEDVVSDPEGRQDLLRSLAQQLREPWLAFRKDLRQGRYDGALNASTASRLTSLWNYALGLVPLESFAVEFDRPGAPGVLVDAFTEELTHAIDELTRPVDAIKHQAKTVTVGISRSDEAVLTVPLVRALLDSGAEREHVGYRDLRTLAALDPAVEEVLGSTRYAIEGDAEHGPSQIRVVGSTGVAAKLRSRTAQNPALRGTKHIVAVEKQLLLATGRSDERTVLIVPEVMQNRTVAITLLHLRLCEHLPAATLRSVLGGYRNRYVALSDAVLETEPEFDETLLEQIPVVQLLTEPVHSLADRWRQGTLQR